MAKPDETTRYDPVGDAPRWGHQPPYGLTVAQYVQFHRQGFLVVPGLVPQDEVAELRQHTEDLMAGRATVPGTEPPADDLSPLERATYYLRIHMLHRHLSIHEKYLLHPRILDTLQALIGPDVMAMQTMLFIKGPGRPGQGYHQDSYYIPTLPDTLCGAWLAIDAADKENGCLRMVVGSQHEPVYPPVAEGAGIHPKYGGTRELADIDKVGHVSDNDLAENDLAAVAGRYDKEVTVEVAPGDVAFFGGHVLHRSLANRSQHRFRRAFVGHYANARSFTTWGGGNERHILARGDTHLPFARPKFGTPCTAQLSKEKRRQLSPVDASMMAGDEGEMEMRQHGDEDAGHAS